MQRPWLERGLRAAAVMIMLAAVIDPDMVVSRRVQPLIALVSSQSSSSRAEDIARRLQDRYSVVRGALPGANGSILIDGTNAHTIGLDRPVVTLATPRVLRIVDTESPVAATVGTPTSVATAIATSGVDGDSMHVELRSGTTLLDRQVVAMDGTTRRQQVTLTFVPTMSGAQTLSVTAQATRSSAADSVTLVVRVSESRWRVHFHDARASWLSTFVRRSVEVNPQFVVTSRVMTSRNVGTITGDGPANLVNGDQLSGIDLLVVGAPDAIRAADVAGLDAFLRRRGGAVLLLFDAPAPGAINSLIDMRDWRRGQSERPLAARFDDVSRAPSWSDGADSLEQPSLQFTEWFAPPRLPLGAVAVGTTNHADSLPVLFQLPAGAGQLWISGALDAWRFRDPSTSRFVSTWSAVLARAAAGALPPIRLSTSQPLVQPGQLFSVAVATRSLLLESDPAASRTIVGTAWVEHAGTRRLVRLYPTSTAGMLAGESYAPERPGSYWVHARTTVNGVVHSDSAPIVVSDAATPPVVNVAHLRALALATRGAVLQADDELETTLDRLTTTAVARVPWNPMRSPWWILPLTILLGVEWWLRRRSGRP